MLGLGIRVRTDVSMRWIWLGRWDSTGTGFHCRSMVEAGGIFSQTQNLRSFWCSRMVKFHYSALIKYPVNNTSHKWVNSLASRPDLPWPSSLNNGPAKPKTQPSQIPYYVIAMLPSQLQHATSKQRRGAWGARLIYRPIDCWDVHHTKEAITNQYKAVVWCSERNYVQMIKH